MTLQEKAKEIDREKVESRVLETTRELLVALGGTRALSAVAPRASLERELGLGSLERVELLSRLEAEFAVELSDAVLARAETPADLVEALLAAEKTVGLAPRVRQILAAASVVAPPAEAETLVDVLRLRATAEAGRPHIYLQEDGQEERIVTYEELYRSAAAVAVGLSRSGVEPGDTVALMLPTSADFFTAFFGILLSGGVPVPLYPPVRMDRIAEYALRQSGILASADAKTLVTVDRGVALGNVLKGKVPALRRVTTVAELSVPGVPPPSVSLTGSSPALIQYTSGSTGDPKGVLLSQRNLLTNVRGIGRALDIQPVDAGASWLPLYHDMGLIGCWFTPLYYGIPTAIFSPLAFLARPERWLWTIHRRRATITAAPNFAFELCVRKVKDAQIEGLDLSSWKAALDGAEPVHPETIERFTRRFERYGFRPESFLPVYGLAESTVALAVPPLGRRPRVISVSRDVFEKEGRAAPAVPSDPSPLRFVSVGAPLDGHEVRLVDGEGGAREEGREGRLEFRGPSTMQGYFRNPDATAAVFKGDGWVDSGDLAFMDGGEIFITGRAKDLIIRGGRNYYPQEIESVAGEVEGVRRGCVVAFGVKDDREGTEKLVVVAETRNERSEDGDLVSRSIQERLSEAIGAPADEILLVPPHTVPKTSSGKLRRAASKELYLKGDLLRGQKPSQTWIVLRLAASEGVRRARLALGGALRFLYGVYFVTLVVAVVLPFWILAIVSPSRRFLARAVRRGARAFLWLAGCRLTVSGSEHFRTGRPVVVVSNHTSYIDPLPLLAALPMDFSFIVKREAAGWPVLGTFIRRLSYLPVERLEAAQSVADAGRMKSLLDAGRSVVIFPEATFTRATGLRPFKLGAFKLAASSGAPVLPVALRGTRRLLRDGNWLPRRTHLEVVVEAPRHPVSSALEDVVRLREETAELLAKNSGEPRLDLVASGFVRKS